MSQSQTSAAPSSKKRWLLIVAALAFFCLVFVLALPFAVRYSLVRWLLDHGAQSADIQKVHINLFTGIAGVDGLNVQLDNNIVLKDQTINVDLALRSLIKKEGRLETGKISGLILDIEKYPDNTLRVGSISIPQDPNKPEKSSDVSWLFRANHLELENCEIRYTMPGLKHVIHIDHAVLNNIFTGKAHQPGTLQLAGNINGTPVNLTLDRIELKPKLVLGGRINIDGYRLDNLQDFLKESLDPITGAVGLKGSVLFSFTDAGAIATTFDGKLTVARVDIGNSSFSTRSPLLSYNGTIDYNQDNNSGIVIDVNGLLQGDQVRVGVPSAQLEMVEKQLQLDGKTRVTLHNGVTVATNGRLNFAGTTLNLPPMSVAHSGFNWQGLVEYSLAGGSGGQKIHAGGKLAVKSPSYNSGNEGFSLQTGADKVAWDGQVDIDLGSGNEPRTIVTNGLLTGNAYQLTLPDLLDFGEETIFINGKTTLTLGRDDIRVQSQSLQQHRQISVLAANTRSHGTMSWQGRVDFRKKKSDSELVLDGKLNGKELDALLEDQQIRIRQQQLDFIPNALGIHIGNKIRVAGKAAFSAESLQINRDNMPLLFLKTIAARQISGTENGGIQVKAVHLADLEIPANKTQPVAVKIPEITIQKTVSTDFKTAATAAVIIKQPRVMETRNQTLLAGLDAISVSNIKVDNPLKVSVASVSAGKGYFFQKTGKDEKPLITLKETKAEKISWSGREGVILDKITLDSLLAEFIRKESEKKTLPKEEATKDKKPTETPLPAVRINSIAVTGPSGFTFDDQTTSVPFFTKFILKNAQVQDIDLAAPDKPFTYSLSGVFDTYSPLDISGTCAPLGDKLVVNSKIRLRNYSLEHISPYVIDTIGTKFVDGQLYITSELKLDGESLDLDNNLVCREIKAQTMSEEAQGALSLPVSLDMALSMLRDSNGDIDLDMPVSGTLSDFSVSKTDIIITALSKALVVAITPYLAYSALGPAGAVAYVGLKAGQDAMDNSLPMLEFADKATDLSGAHRKILKNIGQQIAADKDQDYAICSKAMVWEFDSKIGKTAENEKKILKDTAKRDKLLTLSRVRAENVFAYLMDNFTINADHLLICPPSINYELEGKPTVKTRKLSPIKGIQNLIP